MKQKSTMFASAISKRACLRVVCASSAVFPWIVGCGSNQKFIGSSGQASAAQQVLFVGDSFSEHAPTPLKLPIIKSLSQRAPSFQYRSLSGKIHQLEELKGKVVLIDFWGTWCAGCVQEMPTLQCLYESYRTNPKVAFVIVSQNDSPEKVQAFVEKNHLTTPIYYIGSNAPPKAFASSAWPATYFMSPDGMLRGVHLGGADWSNNSVRKYIDGLVQKYPSPRPK
jgi:thiol-disulfide isomerase/thioredoxin